MSLAIHELLSPTRHMVRAPVNPNDVATVVSIWPKVVHEVKHTVEPSTFHIEPGNYEHPAVLVVGASSWWKDPGDGSPMLEIPCYSTLVADSIVKDYCNAYLGSNGEESGPGLFWVPGRFTSEEIVAKYKPLLAKAKLRQDKLYSILVRMADSFWSRSNGNPTTIGEDMRLAARELGLADKKDWMQDFKMQDLSQCPACGHMVNPKFPVCSNCKAIINEGVAKAKGLQFAKV